MIKADNKSLYSILPNYKFGRMGFPFDANGEINIPIDAESDFWTTLSEQDYKKEANLCFTLSDVDTQYTNAGACEWNTMQVYPNELKIQEGSYIQVVADTIIEGKFIHPDGQQIKRILKYGEGAKAMISVMPCKEDVKKMKDKKYTFKLFENLKEKEDVEIADQEAKDQAPNDEGIISVDLFTNDKGILEKEHDDTTSFLPRLFYFKLYEQPYNKDSKPVLLYPKEYGLGKSNDEYFLDLKTADDPSNRDAILAGASTYLNSLERTEIENSGGNVDAVAKEQKQAAKEAVTDDENLEKIQKLNHIFKDKRQNYYHQLKIAKETMLNKSIGDAAVKIGVQMEKEDSSTGWHDPVLNPQINNYGFSGAASPKSACFGNTRIEVTDGSIRFHSGLDLFGIPEITPVYACLDCKYVNAGGSGHTITLEVINTKELIAQMKQVGYQRRFVADKEYLAGRTLPKYKGEESEFILRETDKIRLVYIHLFKVLGEREIVNKDGIVEAGTIIGYVGVEGNADGTKAPHLHLDVKNITVKSDGSYRLNPALFIKLNPHDTKEQEEASKKQWRDKAHKHLQK